MATLRPLLLSLIATLGSSAALAQDVPLYLGHRSHVKLELGLGLAGRAESDLLSLQPTVEGRLALGPVFGLQLVVPMMFVDLSTDNDGAASRFEIANPTAALEILLDDDPRALTLVRVGVAIPLLQRPDVDSLDALSDRVLQAVNVAMATGARGLFDMWRYAPDTLSFFAEFQGAVDLDSLYLDLRGGAGLLIAINSDAETELTLQVLGRVGYGDIVRPFVGLGVVLIPTETSGLSGEEDAFQLGVQGGLLVELGAARLEAYLQLNIDEPAGFSFDDDGIIGVHAAATVPF
jgi:hypothetical protein